MEDEQQPGTGRPCPRPLASGTPRVAALDALLREIDGLRLALETDLSLAAGALDAGSPELAAQLVGGASRDLVDVEQRALGHLHDLEAADAPAAVVPLQARRARRLARLLPVAPLVAAAAAVVGLLGGLPGGSGTSDADMTSAALSSWEELDRLTRTNAPADDVEQAARSLNARIAALLEASGGDPVAARQALALLRGAQLALAADDDADQLQGVLAQSRALAARLAATLPAAAASSVVPPTDGLPAPAASLLRRLPTTLPTVLASIRVTAPPRASATPSRAASPRPSVTPAASSTAPRTTPSPTPTAQPGYTGPTLLPQDVANGF